MVADRETLEEPGFSSELCPRGITCGSLHLPTFIWSWGQQKSRTTQKLKSCKTQIPAISWQDPLAGFYSDPRKFSPWCSQPLRRAVPVLGYVWDERLFPTSEVLRKQEMSTEQGGGKWVQGVMLGESRDTKTSQLLDCRTSQCHPGSYYQCASPSQSIELEFSRVGLTLSK